MRGGGGQYVAVVKKQEDARHRSSWKNQTLLEKKRQQRTAESALRRHTLQQSGYASDKESDSSSQDGSVCSDSFASAKPSGYESVLGTHISEGLPVVSKKEGVHILCKKRLRGGKSGGSVSDNSSLHKIEIGAKTCARFGGHCQGALGVWSLTSATRRFLSLARDGRQVSQDEADKLCTEDDTGTVEISRWETAQKSLWQLMSDPQSSRMAYIISLTISLLIFVSCVTLCLDTLEEVNSHRDWKIASSWVENICVGAFTVEYLAKLVSTPARMEFVRSPLNIIDLMAILPWYFDHIITKFEGGHVPVLRVVRLVRIFRIFKLGERYTKLQIVARSVVESSDMLMVLLFLLSITIIISSSIMYHLERGEYSETYGYFIRQKDMDLADNRTGQPPESPFKSIPHSFWYCMVTLMTVGYGEIIPTTFLGKVFASILMLISLLILALPISVIGTNFTAAWMDYKERLKTTRNGQIPTQVAYLEEILSTHMLNVEDIIKCFGTVETDLESLRRRVKDKLGRTHTPEQKLTGGIQLHRSFSAPDPSREAKTPSNLLKSIDLELIKQWRREIAVINQLDERMKAALEVLESLLKASKLMCSERFCFRLRHCRRRIKEIDLLLEQGQGFNAPMRELKNEIRVVESSILHLENMADNREPDEDLGSVGPSKQKGASSKVLEISTRSTKAKTVAPNRAGLLFNNP